MVVTIAGSRKSERSGSYPARILQEVTKADKKIKGNERYGRIMSFLTSPETVVQLYFLESSV